MARAKPSWSLHQGRFDAVAALEAEVILSLTVPITAGEPLYRIGWDVKAMRSHGYIAISTGDVRWDVRQPEASSAHVAALIQAVTALTHGIPNYDGGPIEP